MGECIVVRPEDARARPEVGPAPCRSHVSFVAALCRGEAAALRAFFLAFAPLLRDQARRMGVAEPDRQELVTTVLDDVALRLQNVTLPPPELTRYVVIALRNRVRSRHSDEARRLAHEQAAYTIVDAGTQHVVAECHSEYGMRSVAPERELPLIASLIQRLAEAARRALTPEELRMLIGVGHRVPLRELAAQAGITHGAIRVRMHRLRARFLAIAFTHVHSLEPDEQQELLRFFRRAGVTLTAPIPQLDVPPPGTSPHPPRKPSHDPSR